jgi:nucleotide-binding universal stress UspA family protein
MTFNNILLPTDFSDTAEHAMQQAKGLASSFSATLHVLHVIPDPTWSVEGTGWALPDLIGTWDREAQVRLQALESQDHPMQVHTRRGDPSVEISQYAGEHQIDLIVMGTHGHGPIQRMLLGSVAEKVIRTAPCPVLTVRLPEAEIKAS